MTKEKKHKIVLETAKKVQSLYAGGMSVTKLAKKFKVGETTIYRYLHN